MTPHRLARPGAALALAIMCGALITQACERKPEREPARTTAAATTTPTTTPAKPDTGIVPEDGSLAPRDVGPTAPALFIMAGLKGYTEPCGCTLDIMLGGIDRIVGYVNEASKLYPATAVLDTGDLLFEERPINKNFESQLRRKAALLMQAHRALGTKLTVPGELDFGLGLAFYQEMMALGQLKPLGANLTLGDQALPGAELLTLANLKVGIVGAGDPKLYEGIEGVVARDAEGPVRQAARAMRAQGAQAVVLLFHGEIGEAKRVTEAVKEVDFVVVGKKPRETEQVDAIGQGYTLEPHDQGRYLGILKLYANGPTPFVNARPFSPQELATVTSQIEHVEQSINKLPPAAPGEEGPLLLKLRERLDGLKRERERLKEAKVDVPDDRAAFLWRSVPMEPGYPVNASIRDARDAFNKASKADAPDLPIPPVAEGQAFFVGSSYCVNCHVDAGKFWDKTNHAHAFDTLVSRDKDYDPKCVGCHVVGYEQPGGSVVGKVQYEASLNGSPHHKDLRHVGCESCHGAGSQHAMAPLDGAGAPQHISRYPTEQACLSCHVPEHSPRFSFDVYVRQITGPGHVMREAP